jgi:hypothetical protein
MFEATPLMSVLGIAAGTEPAVADMVSGIAAGAATSVIGEDVARVRNI